jgi:protein-disulfide isomerase
MLSTNAPKMLIAAAFGAAIAWIAADRLTDRSGERMAALESGQQAILKELQGLKAQPVRPAAPANLQPPALPSQPLAIAGSASLGRDNAPLTLIEFSDFQCPFCLRHVRQTFDKIRADYIDTGKVRYVFRQFPIQSLHAQAWDGARAAECALRQGKFWEMHERLFANPKQMGPADLEGHARANGLQLATFKQCMSDPAVTAKITQDLDEGARAGVSGTPMFFVGTVENGKVKVLRRLNGAVAYSAFQQTFDSLLQSPPAASP